MEWLRQNAMTKAFYSSSSSSSNSEGSPGRRSGSDAFRRHSSDKSEPGHDALQEVAQKRAVMAFARQYVQDRHTLTRTVSVTTDVTPAGRGARDLGELGRSKRTVPFRDL